MERTHNQHLLNIVNLAESAKRDKWTVDYDADLDSLYWTRPKLSAEVQLTKLSDDSALYLTPEGEVEGMLIEYAKNNFVEHNLDFKPIFEHLTKHIDASRFTLPDDDAQRLTGLLELMADKVANENAAKVLERNIRLDQVIA